MSASSAMSMESISKVGLAVDIPSSSERIMMGEWSLASCC